MQKTTPTVCKMKAQLTIDEWLKLKERFGKIGYMLLKMENYRPLLQKNTSVYLTLLNWLERETGKGIEPTSVSDLDDYTRKIMNS